MFSTATDDFRDNADHRGAAEFTSVLLCQLLLNAITMNDTILTLATATLTNLHMLDFLDTVVLGDEGGVW